MKDHNPGCIHTEACGLNQTTLLPISGLRVNLPSFQFRKKFSFQKGASWVWWHIPLIPVTQEVEKGRLHVQGQSQQYGKTLSQIKGRGCSSVVECLPGMQEALGSVPSIGEGDGVRWVEECCFVWLKLSV